MTTPPLVRPRRIRDVHGLEHYAVATIGDKAGDAPSIARQS